MFGGKSRLRSYKLSWSIYEVVKEVFYECIIDLEVRVRFFR